MKIEDRFVRNYGIDLLKIISCIAVIALHTFSRTGAPIFQICFLCGGFAVPTFFLVNGYLILSRDVDRMKLLKKAGRYLLLAFSWTILVFIVHMIEGRGGVNLILTVVEELFLQGGDFPHFWYLGGLILVYIVLVLMLPLSEKNPTAYYIMIGISFIVMIAMDDANIYRIVNNQSLIQDDIPQAFRLWTWVFYFLLGAPPIMDKAGKIYDLLRKNRWFLLVMAVVINIGYQYIVGCLKLGMKLPEYFYDNILSIVEVLMLFLCCKDLKIENKRARTVISELSGDILGIYIIHLHVKAVVCHFIPTSSLIMQMVTVASVFMISAVGVSIARRVPIVNKLVA